MRTCFLTAQFEARETLQYLHNLLQSKNLKRRDPRHSCRGGSLEQLCLVIERHNKEELIGEGRKKVGQSERGGGMRQGRRLHTNVVDLIESIHKFLFHKCFNMTVPMGLWTKSIAAISHVCVCWGGGGGGWRACMCLRARARVHTRARKHLRPSLSAPPTNPLLLMVPRSTCPVSPACS